MKICFGTNVGGERIENQVEQELNWSDFPEELRTAISDNPFGVPFVLDEEKELDLLVEKFHLTSVVDSFFHGEKLTKVQAIAGYETFGTDTAHFCFKLELSGTENQVPSPIVIPCMPETVSTFLKEVPLNN